MPYAKPPFRDRLDAGRILAKRLQRYPARDPFAVASFYEPWHDLTDEEVLNELERYAENSGGRGDD